MKRNPLDRALRGEWAVPVPMYLAWDRCAGCKGTGARYVRRAAGHSHRMTVCGCVYRGVTREVLARVHALDASMPKNHRVFARRGEFLADIDLVAGRVLAGADRVIWREFHLAGRDWRTVDSAVRLGRGQFFRRCYRVEEMMGRALVETPMFPAARYFSGLRGLRATDESPSLVGGAQCLATRGIPRLRYGPAIRLYPPIALSAVAAAGSAMNGIALPLASVPALSAAPRTQA